MPKIDTKKLRESLRDAGGLLDRDCFAVLDEIDRQNAEIQYYRSILGSMTSLYACGETPKEELANLFDTWAARAVRNDSLDDIYKDHPLFLAKHKQKFKAGGDGV